MLLQKVSPFKKFERNKRSEAIIGGFSNPRNSILMKMFNLIDIGERAGSGIPNIYNVWKTRNWENPQINERLERIERVYLMLPVKKQPIKNFPQKRWYSGKLL
ncbi:MAG: hypothetical protein LBB56_03430 [Chitinispirillales bacterium]|nr:hypothetical protein [Chitinispirillales bacterium]